MAKELAHFQSFAKLKDTKVAFNDITVIAGKPGIGKSYVMKFQYAYNETLSTITSGKYKMHYAFMSGTEHEQMMFDLIKNTININTKFDMSTINGLIEDFNYIEALKLLKTNEHLINESNINKDKSSISLFNSYIEEIEKFADRQKKSLEATEEEKFHFIFRNILESIFSTLDQIDTNFTYKDATIETTYSNSELKLNKLNIKDYYENAIFVETPLIIEFAKFLPNKRFKTPYHIDSLLQELNKKDFSFTSEETSTFINEFRKSTKKILNGNISKGTQGFSFESDNGKTYDIINASSGIKSIGLLQYLVINKALKKGSVLYWEEPEVHLHPEWQLRMIELFVELMNAGVKIVFSTHSPYMCDYLNAISQKKGFDDRVSFNLFEETDGVVHNHILENDDDWNKIQAELLDPLEEIMWEYI